MKKKMSNMNSINKGKNLIIQLMETKKSQKIIKFKSKKLDKENILIIFYMKQV